MTPPRLRTAAAVAALACLAARPAAAADTFVYTGPSGVAFTVTTGGLSSVRVGGRPVAEGGWRMFDAGASCPSVASPVRITDPSAATLERVDASTARVRHEQGDVTVLTTYRFDDEDVRIVSRVENGHASADLPAAAFTGLRLRFERRPDGMLNDTPLERLDEPGRWFRGGLAASCHPSQATPVGGCFLRGGDAGFGGTPLARGLARTLFHGSPPVEEEGGFAVTLDYLEPRPVPRRGAATYELLLRFSANTDWKHLLAPYRDHFRAQHGPTRYRIDRRPIKPEVFASSPHGVSPRNPLGGRPTLDTPGAVDTYCDDVLDRLKRVRGQGVVIWAPGGWEPRGEMFRTDFDVLPPGIEAQLPRLRRRFEESGMRLGLCTRPGEMTVRGTWERDWTFRVNADDRQHLESHLWVRFRRMIDLGFTLYYMDTFGATYDDVRIMQFLREKMGPDIQCFVEHDCDVMTVYAGLYDHVKWDGEAKRWRIGSPNEVYRWLNPDIGTMIVSRFDGRDVEAAGGPPYDHVVSEGCAPGLHWSRQWDDALRGAVDRHLRQPAQPQ